MGLDLARFDLTPPTPEEGPRLLGNGAYAMYLAPDGAVVMAMTDDLSGTEHTQRLGPGVVKMFFGDTMLGRKFRKMISGADGDDDQALETGIDDVADEQEPQLPEKPRRRRALPTSGQ